MSVFIKGLNIKPCKDGFDGKGLVIIGYDDKLYCVAHEQIIPLPDHGDLIDRDAIQIGFCRVNGKGYFSKLLKNAPVVIPAERSEKLSSAQSKPLIKDGIVISGNLCDSCINNGYICQYGIVRSHCDFYKAERNEDD